MQELPIDPFIPEILEELTEHNNLVLTAAPGAGKTTRLPPALTQITNKKIIVLEPRRVAALAAATRVADEQQWQLGQEVGYQVRFENRTRPNTQITFITEALLARKLLADPELSDYGCIVLDEFHERSLHTDLAIGLLKELQSLARPDLKIIVMSATMDAENVSKFLDNGPIVDVPGRIFDLKIQNSKSSQSLNISGGAGIQFTDKMTEQIKSAMSETASKSMNDVLVFLPGVGEIRRLHTQLENWAALNKIVILDLHGNLSLLEQKEVLTPLSSSAGNRKLILATNIAESALTIDGVSVVIDSGLARAAHFNSENGISSLSVQRISKASATQRAGRAARQTTGHVYRMWTSLDEKSMPNFEVPEITRTDLCEVILFLANQGITDFKSFSWYEIPDVGRIKTATDQLKLWGALDSKNQITPVGKRMSQLPLHPRLARLMLEGETQGAVKFAADICAILSEMRQGENRNSQDLDLLSKWESFNKNRSQQKNISKLSEQLCEQLQDAPRIQNSKPASQDILERLLVSAYPDRICRKRKATDPRDRRAIMSTGLGVELSENSPATDKEFFIALQLVRLSSSQDLRVSLTAPLSKNILLEKFKTEINEDAKLEFNDESHKFEKIIQKKLFKMPIEEPRTTHATQQEVENLLPTLAVEKWPLIQTKNEAIRTWLTRLDWYEKQSNQKILNDQIIRAALISACYGEKNLSSIFEKDLVYYFENEIPKDLLKSFRESCPESLKVPSGKIFKIEYFPDKNPTLEARLQEFFGWKENPKISHNSIPDSLKKPIPITLILLGPNYRPVQITQDLGQFWKTSYLEIRKELRGRYPKHRWPEDPSTFSH